MGVLHVAKELVGGEIETMVFNFLRKEHNAIIKPIFYKNEETIYFVKGDDIPQRRFDVEIREIVEKVLTIKIV